MMFLLDDALMWLIYKGVFPTTLTRLRLTLDKIIEAPEELEVTHKKCSCGARIHTVAPVPPAKFCPICFRALQEDTLPEQEKKGDLPTPTHKEHD